MIKGILDIDMHAFLKRIVYSILGNENFEVKVDIDTQSVLGLIVRVENPEDYNTLIGKQAMTCKAIERILIVTIKRRHENKKLHLNITKLGNAIVDEKEPIVIK